MDASKGASAVSTEDARRVVLKPKGEIEGGAKALVKWDGGATGCHGGAPVTRGRRRVGSSASTFGSHAAAACGRRRLSAVTAASALTIGRERR